MLKRTRDVTVGCLALVMLGVLGLAAAAGVAAGDQVRPVQPAATAERTVAAEAQPQQLPGEVWAWHGIGGGVGIRGMNAVGGTRYTRPIHHAGWLTESLNGRGVDGVMWWLPFGEDETPIYDKSETRAEPDGRLVTVHLYKVIKSMDARAFVQMRELATKDARFKPMADAKEWADSFEMVRAKGGIGKQLIYPGRLSHLETEWAGLTDAELTAQMAWCFEPLLVCLKTYGWCPGVVFDDATDAKPGSVTDRCVRILHAFGVTIVGTEPTASKGSRFEGDPNAVSVVRDSLLATNTSTWRSLNPQRGHAEYVMIAQAGARSVEYGAVQITRQVWPMYPREFFDQNKRVHGDQIKTEALKRMGTR